MLSIFLFLLLGSVSGIIAGLLGIGGGAVIVPILVMIFSYTGVNPQYIQHIALGTSMATIIVTAISSTRAQHRHNAVRWDVVKSISPGILIGTFAGSYLASYISSASLTIFFVCFLYFVAIQMILNLRPKSTHALPSMPKVSGIGVIIGGISSLVGIGGGTLTVPVLSYYSVPLHTAVGTSSAVGFPIAVAGTFGYILGGLNLQDLPFGNIGYVNILAFVCISFASFLTAPFGVKLSHKLPIKVLKRVFAIFLVFVATNMLLKLL